MKQSTIIITALSFALLCVSCKEDPHDDPSFDGSKVVFIASTEATRASVSEDCTAVNWNAGDCITILDGNANVRYSTSGSGETAEFISEYGISDSAVDIYAVSPYDASAFRTESGLRVTLPDVQTAVRAGEPNDCLVSVAYSSELSEKTSLQFRNICAFLKISVPEDVKVSEIVLTAGPDEYIAGSVDVSFSRGIPVSTVVEGKNKITLKSSGYMDGTYVVPVLPSVLQNGLNVAMKCENGKVSVNTIIAKDENGVESAVIFERDKINRNLLSFDSPVWRDAPVVELAGISETTATIRWTESAFADPAADYAMKYKVSIYSDESLENLYDSQDFAVEAPSALSCPAFCFSSLQSGHDYWAVVTDVETELSSIAMKISTPESKVVAASGQAKTGSCFLYEDFSELTSGADPLHGAYGRIGDALTANAGELPALNSLPLEGTRLASWQEWVEGHTYSASGYVLSGDADSFNNAFLTPSLTPLSSYATVEVSFKAAPYSEDFGQPSQTGEIYAEVWVITNGVRASAGVVELNNAAGEWTSCTVEALNVLPTSRIAIGGSVGEKSQKQYGRIYIDDVDLKLLRYEKIEDIVAPDVLVESVFWSDATLSWSCAGNPSGFRIYVNGTLVDTVPEYVFQYKLTNLQPGRNNEIVIAAVYGSQEGRSKTMYAQTGAITQLLKSPSPTSVAVGIENMAGSNTGNYNPCLYVELMDSPNPDTANKLFSTYVLDAQVLSPASPFFIAYAVDSDRNRAPLNIAFGGLNPATDYWFRVKCVSHYEFTTYQTSPESDSYCNSTAGDSEFSIPVKLTTAAAHTASSDEVLFMGFDEMIGQADYVNCAVGSFPLFKAYGKSIGDMSYDAIRNWDGDWCFYGLRTVYSSDQLAAHMGWGEQIIVSDEMFTLTDESASGKVTGTAPGVGTKIYTMKDCGKLSGWISSNNTFISQGTIVLGSYYGSKDTVGQNMGMLVTPAISSVGSTVRNCAVSFDALVIQGATCRFQIWVYDSAAKTWTQQGAADLYNSAGLTSRASSWSYADESHKMYHYSLDIQLKDGDRVAFSTDKNGGVVLDNITIKK